MTRGSVGADVVRGKLAELHRVRGEAGRQRVHHELSRLLELACLDSPLIAEIVTALERHGLPTDALLGAGSLAAGEAFALFVGPAGGVAARLSTGEGSGHHVDTAVVRDVVRALSRIAARAGRRLPLDTDLVRVLGAEGFAIEGRSHGLAVAAALLSRALERAPVRHAVAAACLGVDGCLRPVNDLPLKLAALRRRWPEVVDVVVAEGQPDAAALAQEGWNVRQAGHVAPALAFLGLDVLALRIDETSAIDLELRREPPSETTEAYRDRADEYLTEVGRLERAAFFAQVRAAHCLVHAGDAEAAYALLPPLDVAEQLGNEAYATCLTIRATAAIDRIDAEGCVGDAALAVEALGREREPDALLVGEALGTLGRAYLRMGAHAEAIVHLEDACRHFDSSRPIETARTRAHLATALRLGGDAAAALEVAERALAEAAEAGEGPSRAYQLMERARCWLALGEAAAAAADCRQGLALVRTGALYPRVGLLITLREAARVAADEAVRVEMEEAIEAVAAAPGCPEVIRRLVEGGVGVEMY